MYRWITIPLYHFAAVFSVLLGPVLLVLTGVVDLITRSRWALSRVVLFFGWYFLYEVWILWQCAWFWSKKLCLPQTTDEEYLDWHYALTGRWGEGLWRAGELLFSLKLKLENISCAEKGPMYVLIRHTSSGDTVLASALLTSRYGTRLRYIMKEKLQWDPCVDVGGNRLPNAFIKPSDGDQAVEQIRQLAHNLTSDSGVLIYPEGTCYTEAKKRRVLEKFCEKGEAELADYTAALSYVLPPRPHGPIALIEENPDVDVVIFAHKGLDVIQSLWDLWKGKLIGQCITIALWRIPAQDIPQGEEEREAWLRNEWKKVDEWVGLQE